MDLKKKTVGEMELPEMKHSARRIFFFSLFLLHIPCRWPPQIHGDICATEVAPQLRHIHLPGAKISAASSE